MSARLSAARWQTAGEVAINFLGDTDTDVLNELAERLNLATLADAADVLAMLTSNSSPCWACGTGIGDNRVEYYEDLTPARYLHPRCEQEARR